MAKSKKKNKNKEPAAPQKEKIVLDWEAYFGSGELADWQRFMVDLGFTEEFKSKNQCRKALTHVWVNIRDFLDDHKAGREIRRFENERQLADYTKENKKIFPKKRIPKGSPLQKLLAYIIHPRGRHRK